MQKVNQSDWWAGVTGLPSYVNMYIYVPDRPATKPPIVVAPHHCQGTGQGTYSEMSSLVSIADTNGFIMIFPEATGQNCWDAGSTRSLKHDGGGDTGAVVQMVKYTISKYSGDASRVYAVGGSSGGIMTEALLGVYPDVFMAGVSLMGVPCGCWAEGYNDVTGTGSTASGAAPARAAPSPRPGSSGETWFVRYFPGYTGHRPRLQHWHGTADTTLNYKNMAEDIKEWTNLLGLSETPTGTDTPKSGTTHQFWKNSCGYTVYETFSMSGVGHAVPFDGNAVAAYFGLDKAGGQDPETAACPGSTGTGGAGGASGSAGASGSGGASGSAGAGGSGGNRDGGAGMDGGVPDGGGGRAGGSAGASGASGRGGAGGSAGGDSGSGVAGAGGSGAVAGVGGVSGSAGNGGGAGTVGGGGATSAGGSTGGVASGGVNGGGGSAATGGATPGESSASGCSCVAGVPVTGSGAEATALLLAAVGIGIGLLAGRPRRRRGTTSRVDARVSRSPKNVIG